MYPIYANYIVTGWTVRDGECMFLIVTRLFFIFPQCIATGEGSPAYHIDFPCRQAAQPLAS